MSLPTFAEIEAKANAKTTTTTEWADGGTHTRIEYDLRGPCNEIIFCVAAEDAPRFSGLQAGYEYALTKASYDDGDSGVALTGCKIRKNGSVSVEHTERFIMHIARDDVRERVERHQRLINDLHSDAASLIADIQKHAVR